MKQLKDYTDQELKDEFLRRGFITNLWHIEDVQEVAQTRHNTELTDDQAREALQLIEHRHDASIGINWDTIEIYLDEYLEDY